MHSIHPFTDFLKLTVPRGEAPFLRDALEGVIVECGASESRAGEFRMGSSGLVRFGEFGKVGTVSVSGDALSHLRAHEMLLPFLGEVGACPHRVTGQDVAFDVAQDAGPVVAHIYRRAAKGGVRLTRKSIPPAQVTRVQRVGHVDGRPTGTVYLGKRTSDVFLKVYDKRNEVLDQAITVHGASAEVIALNDPGPLTRYEFTFGRKVGMTLRDVVEPTPLFWKFGGNVLPRPAGVPEWEPHAEGYELPRYEPDPVRQLSFLLEDSADVRRLCKLGYQHRGVERAAVLAAFKSFLLHGPLLPARYPVRA